MSRLHIVPTPIGNLKDITLRAIEVLKEADLILAEDTRKTKILLNHYSITTPLRSHHKFNEHREVKRICDEINSGKSVALVSDAGTPAISDPGFLLVRTCIENDIDVETLPGATAFIPALVNSGIPSDRFIFEGFLPQKKGRQKKISRLADEERTIVFYESPYRIVKMLTQLIDYMGPDRQGAIARELSKIHEEIIRGTLQELLNHFTENNPKGEFVIVIEGKK